MESLGVRIETKWVRNDRSYMVKVAGDQDLIRRKYEMLNLNLEADGSRKQVSSLGLSYIFGSAGRLPRFHCILAMPRFLSRTRA